MLQFENVSTFYGKIQALHSVNVEVRQGEIVTLIGANGAGKSTLLMTLCGSPRAHSGSIRYMGEELVGQESSIIMRKSIAVVPEGRRVFARLTVEENLAMGGFFTEKADYQEQMDKVLHLFPRLKERFNQRGGTMSGGEQQMLAHRPRADEQAQAAAARRAFAGAGTDHHSADFRDRRTTAPGWRDRVSGRAKRQPGPESRRPRLRPGGTGEELLVDPKVRDAYLGG